MQHAAAYISGYEDVRSYFRNSESELLSLLQHKLANDLLNLLNGRQ